MGDLANSVIAFARQNPNWIAILAATLGGVAGDSFLYWPGRRYQARIGSLWPFSKHPKLLLRSNAFFQKWGEGAVILGRFSGPVRAYFPYVMQ